MYDELLQVHDLGYCSIAIGKAQQYQRFDVHLHPALSTALAPVRATLSSCNVFFLLAIRLSYILPA